MEPVQVVDSPVLPTRMTYQVTLPNGMICTNPGMFDAPDDAQQAGIHWDNIAQALKRNGSIAPYDSSPTTA